MVVDVFVAEGDGVDSLGDEVLLVVGDVKLVARIVDDLIDSFDESDGLVDVLEEEGSGVGGKFSAVEVDDDGLGFHRGGGKGGCGRGGGVVHCVSVVAG